MDFISIDFETANEKRTSACSMGITKVVNNKIVEEKYWLIKPPEMRFIPQNLWIHGIYPEEVINEKDFGQLWPEIKDYFKESLVVAHNASFDLSVLRSLLDYYGYEYPSIYYGCTVMLSKNHFPNLKNHKLNTVADYVGHKFNHHNAGEDATACAKVMIAICESVGINDLVSLNLKGGVSLGYIFEGGYEPTKSLIKHKRVNTKKEALSNYKINFEEEYFRDRNVVFTGPLTSMKRYEASEIVKKLGGAVLSSVTKKTDILVTGIKNRESMSDKFKSTKLKKAESLIRDGQKIKIITEEEFLSLTMKECIAHIG